MKCSFSPRRMVIVGASAAFFLCSPLSLVSSFAQDTDAEFCTSLLGEHPKGGAGLTAEVRNLVAAAPDVAESVLGCAGSANKAQAKALGAGLAKVVAGLKKTNPALADKIAALVAGSDNKALKTAYLNGDGGEAPAAIDGGAGADDAVADAGGAEAPVTFGGGPAAPVLTVGSSGGGTGGGTVSPN